MRLYNSLYLKIRYFLLFIICLLLTGTITGQVKKQQSVTSANITIRVVDEKENPLVKAKVVVGEGVIHTETDKNGSVSFSASPEDMITISGQGYDDLSLTVAEAAQKKIVTLVKPKIFMSTGDVIPLPFTALKKRNTPGSENVLYADQLEKYPSTDIRNAFTGLIPGVEIIERNGTPGMTPEEPNGTYGITDKIKIYSRGSEMMYIIDNMPADVNEIPLDPQEIESVTFIKDIVGKAMFGPLGANGIVLIKTKHGKKNERTLNVTVEDGTSIIDRMPGWTKASDYATLNNQALTNDGLTPKYSPDDIAAYGLNNPYDKYHPSVNFRDLMLKNSRAFKRANLSASGGNDAVQYSAYLGYSGDGDIYKMGASADYNRINARSKVDIKVNNNLSVQIDIYAGLSFRRSPNYGYNSNYTSDDTGSNPVLTLTELPSVLNDISSIAPNAFPIYAAYDSATKIPWFGVSPNYSMNPIGGITNNGYYTDKGRTGAAKLTLEYDMSRILKGLKSKTFIGYDGLDLVRIGKAEDYIAYIATPGKTAGGNDTILLKKVHDGSDMSGMAKLHDYYYQRVAAFENLSFEKSFGLSNLQTSLTYFLYKISKNGYSEPQRTQSGILSALYSYNNRYIVQAVLNYTGTYSFLRSERTRLFPAIGASWVVSEENFMSSAKFLNYLKLRAETGVLGNDNFQDGIYFRSNWSTNTSGSSFGPYATGLWFGSTVDNSVYRTSSDRIGNPNLTWETRKEFSAGFDALLFNSKVSLEMTYYNILRNGEITQLSNSTPLMAGISSSLPRFNHNQSRYFGLETGLRYTNNYAKFYYSIGGNATIQKSKYVTYDEAHFRSPYQSRIGKPVDSYWGQTTLGKFQSDAEALAVPQLFDAVLHTGDLKYKDMNGDGVVDDNDQSKVGHTTPLLFYSLYLQARYRDFELTLTGTGRAFYDIPMTNKYFWNGWGDNNYSNFVKDNIGGAYPRLTYYKVNNNFVASDFWLKKGGYFKFQNIELAYNLPSSIIHIIRAGNVRIFLRGANLLTLSKIKDVDPESIGSGIDNYPLFKTFSGGLKLTF